MCAGEQIQPVDLQLLPAESQLAPEDFGKLLELPLTEAKAERVDRFERQAITQALQRCAGNASAAARQLGIHRQNLQRKMTQFGISRPK